MRPHLFHVRVTEFSFHYHTHQPRITVQNITAQAKQMYANFIAPQCQPFFICVILGEEIKLCTAQLAHAYGPCRFIKTELVWCSSLTIHSTSSTLFICQSAYPATEMQLVQLQGLMYLALESDSNSLSWFICQSASALIVLKVVQHVGPLGQSI